MKQKGQAKQNTRKELKERLKWTSSTSNSRTGYTGDATTGVASDAPVPYDRCSGPCKVQATWRNSSVTGCTGGAKLKASVQSPCYAPETMSSRLGRRTSGPVTPEPAGAMHRCNVRKAEEKRFRTG